MVLSIWNWEALQEKKIPQVPVFSGFKFVIFLHYKT